MNPNIVQFEVSSSDELREALAKVAPDNKSRFASVRIFGHAVVTRHFELPWMAASDLVAGLKLEASQIFSAKPNEIELCYQILSASEGHIKGVFTAMLQKRLLEYLACFQDSRLLPVSVVSSAISAVADFVKRNPAAGRNYLLINFLSAQAADVVVVMDGEPALFREVNEPTDGEIEKKVVDCVRYCSSRSVSKHLEAVFFIGNMTGKEFLMERLKGLVYPNPTREEMAWTPWQVDTDRLNLLSGYALSQAERGVLARVLSMFLIGAFILAALMVWKAQLGHARLLRAQYLFSSADYQLALELKEKVGHFRHEK